MPFQKGNKYGKGGARPNSGPISDEKRADMEAARKAMVKRFVDHADEFWTYYLNHAAEDPATVRHAIDKFMPHEQGSVLPPAPTIQFIQFNHNHTAPLPAEGLSSPILVSNADEEERGASLAPAERQGKNGTQFHTFANVSRKRG